MWKRELANLTMRRGCGLALGKEFDDFLPLDHKTVQSRRSGRRVIWRSQTLYRTATSLDAPPPLEEEGWLSPKVASWGWG